MWKLRNIYVENLCAFRELDYTPLQGVTTLVFGNNLDNDSQKSNGSGKSALIEAIAIGVSGSPLRKIHGHSEWNQLQHGLATINFHHRTHNLKTHDVEC